MLQFFSPPQRPTNAAHIGAPIDFPTPPFYHSVRPGRFHLFGLSDGDEPGFIDIFERPPAQNTVEHAGGNLFGSRCCLLRPCGSLSGILSDIQDRQPALYYQECSEGFCEDGDEL
mmetsp:Transcript_773/g.1073  ORF Transcript_773/g.1073 Transcript_773/m.1073 type:complete len:115 (+) Transcript_773:546-890(+)